MPNKSRGLISKPKDLLCHLKDIADHKQEHFIVFTLNVRRQIINKHVLFIGTVDNVNVHPREIFAVALEDRAVSIIVAHNHPSGDPSPSRNDITITEQLVFAGQILCIKPLDHVIITPDDHFSFQENRMVVPKDVNLEDSTRLHTNQLKTKR